MDYEFMTISELRIECQKRQIKLKKEYIKRNTLENLLKEDDKIKKVNSPSQPSEKPLFGEPYMSDDDNIVKNNPESPNLYLSKEILVIGFADSGIFPISRTRTLFTGIKDDESLPWIDLTVNKTVPNHTFSSILIMLPGLFFGVDGKEFHAKKLASVLATLKPDGCVKVSAGATLQVHSFNEHLISHGYGCSSTVEKITVKGVETTLNIFRKGESSRNLEVTGKNPSDQLSIEDEYEDPPPPPKRDPGKYSSTNINMVVSQKVSALDRNIFIQFTGITLDQLINEQIPRKEFIDDFVSSIKQLLKYKVVFYKKRLIETQKEYSRIKMKIDKLRIKGVSELAIKEMYPTYEVYAGFIVELEELLNLILSKIKTVNPEEVKKNLEDAINDTEKGLASIIGRQDVKDKIACQLYAFSKSYKTFTEVFNNICMLGVAGVGKTALAKVVAYVFSKSSILATSNIKITSRSELVGQYIGQTAPRTKSVLLTSLEGVLFIDEAYQLTPSDPGRDFGPESITEIVNFLDKYIGMNMVIVAGYEGKMTKDFFPSNEGLARRFPHILVLRKYTHSELTDILIQFIERKSDLVVDDMTGNYLYSVVTYLDGEGVVTNQAGDMLNMGASIVTSVNSSYAVKWKDGNFENNKPILMEGINEYLSPKGMYIME